METLSLIGNAFAGMMNPMSILLLIVGVAVGIVFGSIPGLSAAMAVALFLPVTFAMQAHEAFTLLVALYIGGPDLCHPHQHPRHLLLHRHLLRWLPHGQKG